MFWVIVFTTLVTNAGSAVTIASVNTETTRLAQEVTCRQMERDFTYTRDVRGVTVIGRARCYYDGPDVAVPGRP